MKRVIQGFIAALVLGALFASAGPVPDGRPISPSTVNNVTITRPITGATLTVANGKTLAASNTLTLAGTDGTTMTFPSTNATIARTDVGQTFTGNMAVSNGASNAGFTATTTAGNSFLNFIVGSAHYNWLISAQNNVNNGWEITPSTATGGATYSTPSISGNQAGGIFMPGLPSSSASTTGTVCFTNGTGALNVDTTTTCLLSGRKYKKDFSTLIPSQSNRKVQKLRAVEYTLKPEVNPTHLGRQVGFIADEVAKVDDKFVSREANGEPHAVRYQQMVALLVSAMQDQQRQINALRRQVAGVRVPEK